MKFILQTFGCAKVERDIDIQRSRSNSPKQSISPIKKLYSPVSTNNSSEESEIIEDVKTKRALKVLTYNLFMRPFGITSRWNDYKNQRQKDFASRISEYDIICNQEIFSKATYRRSKQYKLAAEKGLKYHTNSKNIYNMHKLQLPICDSGQTILSRYPIVESEFHAFSHKGFGGDRAAEKGCLWAKVELNKGVYVHVFNTHPQADYGDYAEAIKIKESDFQKFTQICETYFIRISQILEIAEFAGTKIMMSDGSNLVLFMGDINIDAKAPEIDVDILLNRYSENSVIKKFVKNLNEKSTFSEYELLTYILSRNHKNTVQDLAHEYWGYYPITKTTVDSVSDGKEIIMDNYFCNPEKQKLESKTQDYIFTLTNNSKKNNIHIDGHECKIQKFLTPENKKYCQLSDHYGLEATIVFKA